MHCIDVDLLELIDRIRLQGPDPAGHVRRLTDEHQANDGKAKSQAGGNTSGQVRNRSVDNLNFFDSHFISLVEIKK
jgi:hypothetical protein